jgi:hypothetical protein
MKTMFLAAAAVLSLGIGSAYAGDGDISSAPTTFTIIANQQGHVPAPGRITTNNSPTGTAFHAYITNSRPAGTHWCPD